VFAHLNCTNNLKPLKSFLALGVNREAPLRGFGTINPKQHSTIDFFTPLVAAGLLDNVKLVRNVLDSGAKVQYDCYNHEDLSCYCDMDAARSEEMVDVLLEYGGDIELVDSEKWTPCRSLLSHSPSSSSTCSAKTVSSHSIAVTARHPAESGMGTPLWVGRSRRQENQQPASTLYHTTNSYATASLFLTVLTVTLLFPIEILSPCMPVTLPHSMSSSPSLSVKNHEALTIDGGATTVNTLTPTSTRFSRPTASSTVFSTPLLGKKPQSVPITPEGAYSHRQPQTSQVFPGSRFTKRQVAHMLHRMILKEKPRIIRKTSRSGQSGGMRRLGLFRRQLR
jgi:hypothetical protein